MASNLGALVFGNIRSEVTSDFDGIAESMLVEKCRKQDPQAFGELVDRYEVRVYGFIKRMTSNSDDAADLTQEVFIKAFRNFHRFDLRSSVKTWLFKIAHNLCIDCARRKSRTPDALSLNGDKIAEEDIEVADSSWQPDTIVVNEELSAFMEKAIAKLSDKLKSVLLMHDREDLSYEEIAGILNIPIGTVKSRLFLSRTFLQNELKSYFDLTTGGSN